jgi:hypothetical protein
VRRIFLVGTPRSGTTLIQSTLAAHPDVHSLPETHFFALATPRTTVGRLLGLARPKFALQSARAGGQAWPTWRLGPHVRNFLKALDEEAQQAGASVWLEKTPQHLKYVEVIERQVPSPRYIHVLRHAGATAASLRDVSNRFPLEWHHARNFEECLDRWELDVETSARYGDHPRHAFVRYEDFVERPIDMTAKLLGFLGFDPDDAVARMMLEQRAAAADRIALPSEPWKANNMSKAIAVQRDWTAAVTDSERTLAESVNARGQQLLARMSFL